MRNKTHSFPLRRLLLSSALLAGCCSNSMAGGASVGIIERPDSFTLTNSYVEARVEKRTGVLSSLKYKGLEMLAQKSGGSEGGYWSSVGRGRTGSQRSASIRINPAENGGLRGEVSCRLFNDPDKPDGGIDADYRYDLGRDDHGIYVYSVLNHKPGYPGFGVGEARYCLKLNPATFDYLYIDANRHRVMPSGYDWDHGSPLNLKEARRMTTGVHKGEPEHKYDYSAVLAETPAYGWLSTGQHVGLWMVNPSIEYLGGGPTKAELTGHLDVNPGGLPTLLNMWVGSHYGGTSLAIGTNENWVKVVGPFFLYCNSGADPDAMSHDALSTAAGEQAAWPYHWMRETNYPLPAERSTVAGQLVLHDPGAPGLRMSNLWVGVTAPDYPVAQTFVSSGRPNRFGMPQSIDWQRDAKFYQFWTRGDEQGRFTVRNVRPGRYTLHAIAEGVLGEFTLTNVVVAANEQLSLGELTWTPVRYGRTIWEIGVPDRTAREFRHGDHYWQWGPYFDYPREFPNDVDFVIGKSDWHRDWNYVQPPRFEGGDMATPLGEEEEQQDNAAAKARHGRENVHETTWQIRFQMPAQGAGGATLRLAFCGTHLGCHVEVFVNGKSVGDTGILPSTSTMQRDGIRAYWVERPISFDGRLLAQGENTIKLLSHANSWSQGVLYDYLRLEIDDQN